MATTTGTLIWYDNAVLKGLQAVINFNDTSADGFGILLTNNTHVPAVTDDFISPDIDNEQTGAGFARVSLANVTIAQTGGVVDFDCDNVVFTNSSGGDKTVRYWHMYYDDSAADTARELICYGLIDNTPADVVVSDGNTLTLKPTGGTLFTATPVDA